MGKEAYTVGQMVEALQRSKGMVYLAAGRLGCSPQTIYNSIECHPTLATLEKLQGNRPGDC